MIFFPQLFYILINWVFSQKLKSLSYQLNIFYLATCRIFQTSKWTMIKAFSYWMVCVKRENIFKTIFYIYENGSKSCMKCWPWVHSCWYDFADNVKVAHKVQMKNFKWLSQKDWKWEWCFTTVKVMIWKTGTLACVEPELNGSSWKHWLCVSPTIINT